MSTPHYSKKPAHVLMTADTVGGVWSYAMELVRGLEPHGVNVTLATMGLAINGGQAREAAALPNLQIRESRYRLEWMEDPWDDVQAAGEWLLGLETEAKPDVVHLNNYGHGGLDWSSPVVVVGHSCVFSWWEAVKREPAPAAYHRYRNEVSSGLCRADCVVAPSRSMLAALRRHYGSLPRGHVIPNGRSCLEYVPRSKDPIILSAGRLWDEAKNARALAYVAHRLPWPVYLAGEEQHPEGGVFNAAHIRSLGRLDKGELAKWYSRASLYALPARYEPFGLSVLEAALSGCALVLGDIASLREHWNGAATFVSPHDPVALESALKDLIEDSHRLRLQAAAARARAMTFTPERMAHAYMEIYRSLLRAPHPHPVQPTDICVL